MSEKPEVTPALALFMALNSLESVSAHLGAVCSVISNTVELPASTVAVLQSSQDLAASGLALATALRAKDTVFQEIKQTLRPRLCARCNTVHTTDAERAECSRREDL